MGSNNTQYNFPVKPPVNAANLVGRSPHAAAAQIRQLSHEEAVDLFATAPAEVLESLAEKLKPLLQADDATAIAILADLDPGKAAVLIRPYAGDYPRLADLPVAAEAIDQCAVELKWTHEEGEGRLELAAQSPQGTDGYSRQYRQGRIYWSNRWGRTFPVDGPIAEVHEAGGGTGRGLGFPDDRESSWRSPKRTNGERQPFEGGYIASSGHGVHAVSREFWDIDPDGVLGFPVAPAWERIGMTSQPFEGGTMCSSEAGAFSIRWVVADLTAGCVPIAAERELDSRPSGRVQHFKDNQGRVMAVYSSDEAGAHLVDGRILALYEKLGGPGSWLGFPLAPARDVADYRRIQKYENGSIYGQFDFVRVGAGLDLRSLERLAVPAATVELVSDSLGWPLSQEKSVGGSDNETIQYFEKGVVTLRYGKREVWLRPPSGK